MGEVDLGPLLTSEGCSVRLRVCAMSAGRGGTDTRRGPGTGEGDPMPEPTRPLLLARSFSYDRQCSPVWGRYITHSKGVTMYITPHIYIHTRICMERVLRNVSAVLPVHEPAPPRSSSPSCARTWPVSWPRPLRPRAPTLSHDA